jgi:hypothetical protein
VVSTARFSYDKPRGVGITTGEFDKENFEHYMSIGGFHVEA